MVGRVMSPEVLSPLLESGRVTLLGKGDFAGGMQGKDLEKGS